MRKNEYKSLEEFTSQYIGEWSPSDGHWYGLEFRYGSNEYRLHTWQMHADDPIVTPDGHEVLFGLYSMNPNVTGSGKYILIASFASMDELLNYSGIGNQPFRDIIMDDNTEITGQD